MTHVYAGALSALIWTAGYIGIFAAVFAIVVSSRVEDPESSEPCEVVENIHDNEYDQIEFAMELIDS